MIFDT